MDENEEQEQTIVDKGVEAGKKYVKTKAKKGFWNLIKPILPIILQVIGVFFAGLLLIGLTMVIQKLVMDTFNSILGITTSVGETTNKGVLTNNIIAAAQEVHDEEMDWIYYTEHASYKGGADTLQAEVEKALNNPNKTTCCATYVSCVLYRAGCFTEEEINSFNINSPAFLNLFLKDSGWEKIEDAGAIQPGDILFQEKDGDGNPDHTQIYAGNDMWYNAGNTYAIQNQAPMEIKDWQDCNKWWFYRSPDLKDAYMKSSTSFKDESLIEIDDRGAYRLKEKDLAKQIREKLKEQKVDNQLLGLEIETEKQDSETGETIKEIEDMIDSYVKAEVQTTYPETGIEPILFQDNLDGIITIKRASVETGKVEKLDYIKYSDFCNLVQGNSATALKKFSLNPDNFKLCIAKRGNTGESAIVKEEIEYRKYVQNYSVPLNFFISLHLISQDADFMKDVVDMVLGEDKEDPIELTYVEKIVTTTTSYNYTGLNNPRIPEESDSDSKPLTRDENDTFKPTTRSRSILIAENEGTTESTTTSKEKPIPITNENISTYYSGARESTVHSYISGELVLTNADTWLKSSGKEISETTSSRQISSSTTDKTTVKNEDGIFIQESSTTTKTETTFKLTEKEEKINIDDFVELIRDYPKVENNLTSAPSDLFYLLQQTEKTQRLERIMRYVLYRLTDINYGVLEEDLEALLADIYSSNEFQTMNNFNQWEELRKYLRQYGGISSSNGYYQLILDTNYLLGTGSADINWKAMWPKFSVPGKIRHNGVEKEVPDIAQYVLDNFLKDRGRT